MNQKDIEMLKLRDEITFNKFYDKYHRLFFNIIYNIVKDFSATEELTSDTFCTIIECIEQYNDGNFKYWCITICKNIANMYLRKIISERVKIEKYLDRYGLENSESYKEQDRLEEIKELLLTDVKKIVDKETYEIIILRLVQNIKFKEIANIRKETTSAILGRYHRGIKLIRSKINYEDYR